MRKLYACLNATYESGYLNPIDAAIRNDRPFDLAAYQKLDEVPYDFLRKRLSILVPLETVQPRIQAKFEELSQAGFRTLGLAYRDIGDAATIRKESEAAMIFLGFVVLADPPKASIGATIQQLAQLGVALKIITGDNRAVAPIWASRSGWLVPTS